MLANSCKDLDRSGSRRYEKLCAWSVFNGSVTCWLCSWFSLVGLTKVFSCFGNFAIFPPLSFGVLFQRRFTVGEGLPHTSAVLTLDSTFCHGMFNRWLIFDSRCEIQMTVCHTAFQPVVDNTLTV